MANDAAREAAAALAPAMLEELVDKVPLPPSAGEDVLAADLQAQRVEAEPQVPSGPAQTAPAQAQAVPAETDDEWELPSFEPQLTDELRELLDEPDFEEEAALEVAAQVEDSDDYIDDEAAKRIKALEKKVEWQEAQLVRANKKKWVAENLRAYPLLATYAKDEVEKIAATSRRGFAREAATLNARFEKIAAPLVADIRKAKESLATEVRQEERQAVQAAWGEPVVGPANVAVEASGASSAMQAARKSGQLHKVIGELFKQSGVGGR